MAAILVVCGPTGSGKGQLGRELARRLGGEIISADSRKLYRGFDIGTAKPTARERAEIPHHLIDVADPLELFTAKRFVELADRAIVEITERKKVPIVVGGTGLYIRALIYGIIDTPSRNDQLRSKFLEDESKQPGSLHQRLCAVDPKTAAQILPRDLVRIVRALEVFTLTGRLMSDFQTKHGFKQQRYRVYQMSPHWPKKELVQRIQARVERMIQAGWLDEVAGLLKRGLGPSAAFRTVGYHQLKEYLEGKSSIDEAIEKIKRQHQQYARRQLSWFRGVPDLEYLPTPVEVNSLCEKLRIFIEREAG